MASARPLLSFLIVAGLLVPVGNAAALYRCAMTGEVHVGRCCGGDEHQPSGHPEIQPEECCQLVTQPERVPTPTAQAPSSFEVPLGAAGEILALVPAPRWEADVSTFLEQSRAPPHYRDLWLLTRTLLI